MTQLSIIIPTCAEQAALDETVLSVLENRPTGCEVILVQSPEYADPYDLGDEVRFVDASDSDRIRMLNEGIREARGEIVHLLLPGVTVGPGWCASAISLFEEDRDIGSVSPCIVARQTRKTILGVDFNARLGKKLVRSARQPILAPLLGTGFYRASALRFMHGFDDRFGDCADVELGLRMKSASYKASHCDSRIHSTAKVTFSARRGFQGGVVRRRLSQLAVGLGLVGGWEAFLGVLGEPLTNRFGVATLTAMIGRMSGGTTAQRDTHATMLPIEDSVPGDPKHRRSA